MTTARAAGPVALLGLLVLYMSPVPARGAPTRPWTSVHSFLYQLQGTQPLAVGKSGYDLVIMDYSRDGSEEGRYTRDDLRAMQHSPRGRKLVLAYLSIGEAEDYRWYWQPSWKQHPPPWLEKLNPQWKGNYKVRYWDPEWQDIIHQYLRKIQEAGFDGVYLDIIDGYEHFEDQGVTDAAERMVAFVERIAGWARGADSDFGIFPQNGEQLLKDAHYRSVITGIGSESVSFGADGTEGKPTPPGDREQVTRCLDLASRSGRLVLATDYTRNVQQIDEAYRYAAVHGWVAYCTTRALDTMTIPTGHTPQPALPPWP